MGGQRHALTALHPPPPPEESTGTHCRKRWVGDRVWNGEKYSAHTAGSNPGPSRPLPTRHTDYSISAPLDVGNAFNIQNATNRIKK
jgi:hypothetical protein